MRLAAQAKGGFYPTPPRVTDLIAELIQPPAAYARNDETLRILDPCCGEGDALSRLAEGLGKPHAAPVETFGVELHTERAEEAKHRLDRVLGTDLFATSIANGAFGLLYLNPPYDWDSGEEKRVEHAFLTHCTRYLAEDGLLVLVVPRQRLAVSARYLASHFSRIDCWAFPQPEREAYDQVVLLGYRKAEVFLDAYAEERIHQWAADEAPELGPRRYPLYVATATPAGDVLFARRTIDPVAAAAEARTSGLWANTAVMDLLWPAQDQRTRPLMPLRRGHLAMLVAAGFLDNLQLEAGDSRILVKGRTSKEMVLAERTPTKETFRERLRTTVVALDLDSGQVTDIAA